MTGPQVFPNLVVPLTDIKTQSTVTMDILRLIFPSWTSENVEITSLKGGITNCVRIFSIELFAWSCLCFIDDATKIYCVSS